jgi:hypothetical protein
VLQEAELSGLADSENDLGGSSETMYFIGLDVHKKSAIRTFRPWTVDSLLPENGALSNFTANLS